MRLLSMILSALARLAGPVLMLAFTLTPVHGSTVTLLGPQDVVRAKGKPRPVVLTFHSGDPTAPHVLRIANGGEGGNLRKVAAAVIRLNGVVVLGPNRFNAREPVIEQAIRPREENTLIVELRGEPRAGFTIRVDAVDTEPPVITDILPADGTVVTVPEVVVSAVVEDLLSGVQAVTCDGVEATPAAGVYACTVPLVEGANEIEIVATDRCGNSSSASLTVIFDVPPVVAITDPQDGALLFASPVSVTGTVDDPTAEVTVNGVPASGTAPFHAEVPLAIGEQTLTALARDLAGGEGTDSITVTVLSPGFEPTISIQAPADGFVIGGPRTQTFPPAEVRVAGRVRVSGSFNSGNKPDVSVNGSPADVFKGASPGALCNTPLAICWWDFAAGAIPLAEGSATITAVGVDKQGRSGTSDVRGIVDVCVDGGSDGPARVGVGQSNRCHVIDGCSTPDVVAPDVQDPTAGTLGRHSTAFGKDTDMPPAPERFPHGGSPRDRLPCNLHDVCYQTCGAVKVDCDRDMYERMNEVCRAAYPETTCPYTVAGPFGTRILDPVKCPRWRSEKDRCYSWARTYRAGLASPQATTRFDLRQSEYCEP